MSYSYDHVRLAPDKQIGRHSQPGYELSYIITGRGERTLGSITEPFKEGEVVLVPPRIPHQWRFDTAAVDSLGCIENITFHFPASFPEDIARLFPDLAPSMFRILNLTEAVLYSGEVQDRLVKLLVDMESKSGPDKIALIASLMEAISFLDNASEVSSFTPAGSPQQRMEKIRIYVSCNFARKILLEDIAAHIGMNRSAFCSFFRQQIGKTFITWLNEYRIEKACDMLSGSDMRVGEVATAVGFESLPHFTRIFRQIKGMPPTQWTAHTSKESNQSVIPHPAAARRGPSKRIR
jgi:AraC-like DNA-binding protein